MYERNKYVYIITCDEPIEAEQELNLFRACHQEQIFALRSCLSNEEILRLVKSLKLETFQNNNDEKKSTGFP